jgi:hypothetical protein
MSTSFGLAARAFLRSPTASRSPKAEQSPRDTTGRHRPHASPKLERTSNSLGSRPPMPQHVQCVGHPSPEADSSRQGREPRTAMNRHAGSPRPRSRDASLVTTPRKAKRAIDSASTYLGASAPPCALARRCVGRPRAHRRSRRASAQAALISTSACDNAALTQPFLPWGDSGRSKLVPGGDFERGQSGWTLSGGARTVSGGEPYRAAGSASTASLLLPAGASAQSPFTCVNAAYPTFRFFARNAGLLSNVLVQVVYRAPSSGQSACRWAL